MAYSVTVLDVAPRWIAGASAIAKPGAISAAMLAALGKAWGFIKPSGLKTDGMNVAIYQCHGDQVRIIVGPGVYESFERKGEIGCVATPSGRAAMTIHMGPYELLGQAHGAVREWCAANGHALEGTNWEIYGHHEDDPSRRRTDVFYLLRS